MNKVYHNGRAVISRASEVHQGKPVNRSGVRLRTIEVQALIQHDSETMHNSPLIIIVVIQPDVGARFVSNFTDLI